MRQVAVPLTVTTRGIGFATAIFYDRAMSTCSVEKIYASIHQVYRVGLWLLHYKVYRTQKIQHECKTADILHRICGIDDIFCKILDGILEVPKLFSMVLDAIGKIETNHSLYHLGYAIAPSNPVELLRYRTLVITPTNIRETLDFLANPNTPIEDIAEYRKFNSIPGLYFDESGHLTNANDVYPAAYSDDLFRNDVRAFQNLLTTVRIRLPSYDIVRHSWSGKTTKAGLWSSARINSKVESTFSQSKINAEGESVQQDLTGVLKYQSSFVTGGSAHYWAREKTSEHDKLLGIGSMVGEECFVSSRSELNSLYVTSDSAKTIMCENLDYRKE